MILEKMATEHNTTTVYKRLLPFSSVNVDDVFNMRDLTALPFWRDMSPIEQETLQQEFKNIIAAYRGGEYLSVGESLIIINRIGHDYHGSLKLLGALIDTRIRIGCRTQARIATLFKNVRERFPKNVVLAMNEAKLSFKQENAGQLYGKYTAVISDLGIPESASEAEAKEYVERVVEVYNESRKGSREHHSRPRYRSRRESSM